MTRAVTPSAKSGYASFAGRALPSYLRFFATLSFLFGGMIVVVAGFGAPAHHTLERVFRWAHHPAELPPAAMLGAIYVAWGVFIWLAARDPRANRMFIDFTVAGNAAHGSIMIYMALTLPGMVEHLYTDTLLLILGVPVLVALWLPVRGSARPTAAPGPSEA